MDNYNTLVFEGGGVKGIAYIGALKYLSEVNVLKNIQNFAGTSSGSQIATLLAIGYKIDELEEILLNTPFEDFLDYDYCSWLPFCCCICRYGLYNGTYLKNYLDKLIQNKLGKKNATFQDLWNKKNTHLKITGTCLEKKKIFIFDYINSPNMEISLAIQISSCIPFVFKPIKYNGYTFVDGGCIRNFPINIFENSDVKTIALELISDYDNKDSEIINFTNYSKSIISTIHNAANKIMNTNPNIKIIKINTGHINSTDFDISTDEKKKLIEKGYNSMNNTFS